MVEREERVIRVERKAEEKKVEATIAKKEKEISIEIPSGMELSEEEMKGVVSATQNEIVDVIRGSQAKTLAERATIAIVAIRIRYVDVA